MTDGSTVLYGLGALSAAHVMLPLWTPGRGLLTVASGLLGAAAGATLATTHGAKTGPGPAALTEPTYAELSVRSGHKGAPRPWTPHSLAWASHVDYEHEHLAWYPPANGQTKRQNTSFRSPVRGWRPHEPGGQVVTEGVPAMGTVFPKTRGEEALTVGPLDSDHSRRPRPGLDPVTSPLPPIYTARAHVFGGGISHAP